MLVTLELNNKDPVYPWFLEWMAHQTRVSAASPSFLSRLTRSHQLAVETVVQERENGSKSFQFLLVAGPGTHIFKYQGAWVQVKRERDTRFSASSSEAARVPWETVTLTTLSRDRTLFPALLAEARDVALQKIQGKLIVYTAWDLSWRPFGKPLQKRPLSSVILAPGVRQRVESDVRAFLERRQWYADRGKSIPCYIIYHALNEWFNRHSIPERLPSQRTTWVGKVVIYPSTGRLPWV